MNKLTISDFKNDSISADSLIAKLQDDPTNAIIEVFETINRPSSTEGALTGVPIVIKDNLLYLDHKASAGSKMLEHYVSSFTATALQRLLDAGAHFSARANMDEFAMGSSTETSFYGPTLNPLDLNRVPGGSSGGPAAAVAAGYTAVALGTDTGGSIRQPAALCGLVGFKPTYGAVSRYGAIAMGSSLDQIGPITNTVKDAEMIFNIMRGEDPNDLTTILDSTWESQDALIANREIKRIGVPWNEINRDGIDPGVLQNFNTTIDQLKTEGYEIIDLELPLMPLSLSVYYILMPAEVSSNLGRYDGVRYGLHVEGTDGIDSYFKTREAGFGAEVQRRILLGTYVLSAGYYDSYYGQALNVREAIIKEFQTAFKTVDVIATPTTPTPAFKLDSKTNDPLQMYLEDIYTVPANITGMPAIAVPNGTTDFDGAKDLPTSIQFIGNHLDDALLFKIATQVEDLQ